jgi:hypothetical protein
MEDYACIDFGSFKTGLCQAMLNGGFRQFHSVGDEYAFTA